jgi:hypothetical protein
LFIYLLYRLLTISIDSKEKDINLLAPVIIFIIFSGITEITPLLYGKDMFTIFYILATYLSVNNCKSTIIAET